MYQYEGFLLCITDFININGVILHVNVFPCALQGEMGSSPFLCDIYRDMTAVIWDRRSLSCALPLYFCCASAEVSYFWWLLEALRLNVV